MTVLTAINPTDATRRAEFDGVAAAASAADGYSPFNEQSLFDVTAGRRLPHLITAGPAGADADGDATVAHVVGAVIGAVVGAVVGAAITGLGEIDLVIAPLSRRHGHGTAALQELLRTAPAELTAWSHGDHPGARALAARFHFVAARTLLEMRLPLPAPPAVQNAASAGFTIGPFAPETDTADWVALNALVFAEHPEQGALTADDLGARQAEPWFDSGDFLIARDRDGRMVGYNWLKVEGDIGEIYVLGVHPDTAGAGLGRTLMNAGLARLDQRGATVAALYVEADSLGPVHLYRSLGFTDHTVDVQYRRMDHPDRSL